MSEFAYLPVRGALSGASFEAQTVAFFEKLQKETTENLDVIRRNMQAMQLTIDGLQTLIAENARQISLLQTLYFRIQELQEENTLQAEAIAYLRANATPDGFIGLAMTENLPKAWRVCNGENETPNLSGYTVSPLRFIQKRQAG